MLELRQPQRQVSWREEGGEEERVKRAEERGGYRTVFKEDKDKGSQIRERGRCIYKVD